MTCESIVKRDGIRKVNRSDPHPCGPGSPKGRPGAQGPATWCGSAVAMRSRYSSGRSLSGMTASGKRARKAFKAALAPSRSPRSTMASIATRRSSAVGACQAGSNRSDVGRRSRLSTAPAGRRSLVDLDSASCAAEDAATFDDGAIAGSDDARSLRAIVDGSASTRSDCLAILGVASAMTAAGGATCQPGEAAPEGGAGNDDAAAGAAVAAGAAGADALATATGGTDAAWSGLLLATAGARWGADAAAGGAAAT